MAHQVRFEEHGRIARKSFKALPSRLVVAKPFDLQFEMCLISAGALYSNLRETMVQDFFDLVVFLLRFRRLRTLRLLPTSLLLFLFICLFVTLVLTFGVIVFGVFV